MFYYDAIDSEPRQDETRDQAEVRIAPRVLLHQQINSIPNFHVREGWVSRARKPKNREQKAVDVHLAVDALEQAALRNMSHATLLLGDLDFQPLISALVRFGIRVTVYYEAGAREELLEAADERNPLTLAEYQRICASAFRDNNVFPSFGAPGRPSYPVLMTEGIWRGHKVFLAGHGNETHLLQPFELFVEGGDESRGLNVSVYYNLPDFHKAAVAFELAFGGTIRWTRDSLHELNPLAHST